MVTTACTLGWNRHQHGLSETFCVIQDFVNPRDNSCYLAQDNLERFPKGNYRSKWYQTGFGKNQFCAIGIHGQNIWVNPKKELTIIRMSSASDPINIKTEELMFSVFEEIGNYL